MVVVGAEMAFKRNRVEFVCFAHVFEQGLRLLGVLICRLLNHIHVLFLTVDVQSQRTFNLKIELYVQRKALVFHRNLAQVHLNQAIWCQLKRLDVLSQVLLAVDVGANSKPEVEKVDLVGRNRLIV